MLQLAVECDSRCCLQPGESCVVIKQEVGRGKCCSDFTLPPHFGKRIRPFLKFLENVWLRHPQVHSLRLLIFLGFVFLAIQMLKEILCNKRCLFQVVPLKWSSIGSLKIWTGMDYFGRKLNSSRSWNLRMTQAILTVRLKIQPKQHRIIRAYFIFETVREKSLLEIERNTWWKSL